MAERISVKFGTTEQEVRRQVLKIAEAKRWDLLRVRYVVDIDACNVKETVYAVSDRTSDLPMHPSGPDAVQKLIQ